MRRLCPVALLVAVVVGLPSARGGEGSDSPKGQIRLASGLAVQHDYHFDRNAFADSVEARDGLVVLTTAGVLLRFDPNTLQSDRMWFGPSPAVCLGRGTDGAVLVGFEDGRICRVDPVNLKLAEIVRLSARPDWVGYRPGDGKSPGGIVAVVMQTKPEVADGQRWDKPVSEVHDLSTGKTYLTDDRATVFLLDTKQRLWMGADHGEWGGSCSKLDLPSGKLESLPPLPDPALDREPFWPGVYGLAELPGGAVWAYGGTMHMGFVDTFLHRIDGAKVQLVYHSDNRAERPDAGEEKPDKKPTKSRYPITHVVPQRAAGGLIVFSYSDLLLTDPALKSWTTLPDLELRYSWGRPDAVGTYPSLRTVHPRKGEKVAMLCATARDGYILIADGRQTRHAVSGQLEAREIDRIETTGNETLFLEWDDRTTPWRLSDEKWSTKNVAPPVDLIQSGPKVEGYVPSWDWTTLLVGTGGTHFTISAEGGMPGTRTTARWSNGQAQLLGRESSSLNPSASFVTPDGTLWNAYFGKLRRFLDGRWTEVALLPGAGPDGPRAVAVGENVFEFQGQGLDVGTGLKAFGQSKPPWVLLDRDEKHLLGLTHGPSLQDPRITLLPLKEADQSLEVHDALDGSPGELILATNRGLRLYEIATGKTRPAPLPSPDRPVKRLARDSLGRLWLGGEGLLMIDEKGRLHDLAEVPMIGRSKVSALAADGRNKDGVIVSLGIRGVAFLRVEAASR